MQERGLQMYQSMEYRLSDTAVPVPKNTKIIVPINSTMYSFMLVLLIYHITNIMELLSQGAHITFIIIYKFSVMPTILFDIIV